MNGRFICETMEIDFIKFVKKQIAKVRVWTEPVHILYRFF